MRKVLEDDTFSKSRPLLHAVSTTRKLQGYKSQDKLKGIFNAEAMVTISHLENVLFPISGYLCFYCNQQVALTWENVKDPRQWTLDRIDNDMGHNIGNVIIACLGCNLSRKRRTVDAYLFTKTLNIVRIDTTK